MMRCFGDKAAAAYRSGSSLIGTISKGLGLGG